MRTYTFRILVPCVAFAFAASMAWASNNVWDGTTDQNWTGANWTIDGGGAGGTVPPDAGTPGANLIDYLYTGHSWLIGAGGTINQDVQIRLDGGTLDINGASVSLLPTSAATGAGLSGLNLGQSGTPTMATLTDSTLTAGRSNQNGNSLRLMNGSSLIAVNSEINVQAEPGLGDLDIRNASTLSLAGTTLSVQRNSNLRNTATLSLSAGSTLIGQGLEVLSADAKVTLDGATIDVSWIRLNSGAETTRNLMFDFIGGTVTLNDPNPFRDNSSFEGAFDWTGGADSGSIIHTDLSDASGRTLAYKTFQGFFSIDGTRINPTTDPLVSGIPALNAELATLAVGGEYLQIQEGTGTQTLVLIPEPGTLALLGLGALALVARRRR